MAEAQTETTGPATTDTVIIAAATEVAEAPAADEIQTPEAPDPVIEAAARAQGWVPKEQYRGDQSKWVDAKTFADRAEQINPIIKADRRKLQAENEELRKKVDKLQEDGKTFADFVRTQERARYDAQLATLNAARAEAISEGDGAKVVALETEIGKLKPPAEPKAEEPPKADAVAAAPPELVEAAKAFGEKNPWYNPESPDYNAPKARILKATAAALLEDQPDLRNTPGFFAALERRLQADYPQVFAPAKPKSMVDGGGTPSGGGGPKGKTFKDMPKEAQDVATRWKNNGWIKSVDDYTKTYFEEQEKAS